MKLPRIKVIAIIIAMFALLSTLPSAQARIVATPIIDPVTECFDIGYALENQWSVGLADYYYFCRQQISDFFSRKPRPPR